MKTSSYIYILLFIAAFMSYLWYMHPLAAIVGGVMLGCTYIIVLQLSAEEN